jgi:hypothetical protein
MDPALKERRMICTKEHCSPSILAALSELSCVLGTSSWASVRPGPDSDPGYTLVAPSALKSAYFSALRKKHLIDRQYRLKSPQVSAIPVIRQSCEYLYRRRTGKNKVAKPKKRKYYNIQILRFYSVLYPPIHALNFRSYNENEH